LLDVLLSEVLVPHPLPILAVIHRHLNHQGFTLAAIDDIISRGKLSDWRQLRSAALTDHTVVEKIQRICLAHLSDSYAQRYHFWMNYVTERLA
jgi:hypothetical protein